jgi:hypothetical protein
MPRDFYSTAAQVLPVLLLALVWESKYLDALPGQQRRLRRDDPERGVWFCTKSRVRVYALAVATLTLAGILICLLVLAGLLPDWTALGAVTVASLALTSVSLLYRIWSDIVDATRVAPDEGQQVNLSDIQE